MNPHALFIVALAGLLIFPLSIKAQEMDAEISALATKLSGEISKGGRKKVAVLDFTDLQDNRNNLGQYIAEELTVQLVQAKTGFSVFDRANLRRALSVHELTANDLVDLGNARKLGASVGIDGLILGTVTPKGPKVSLTAKLIATDTAEIISAMRAEFTKDDTVQHLLSEVIQASHQHPGTTFPGLLPKPFGDLRTEVESFKLLPGDGTYGYTRLSLIVSNASPSKVYGLAFPPRIDRNVKLINDRGEEFDALELIGVEQGEESGGQFYGSMSEILPKSSLLISIKSRIRWEGNPGDYRPYRFQTIVLFGVQDKGKYTQLKKHNLVFNIK